MKPRIGKSATWLSALSVSGAILTGCVFGDGPGEPPKDGPQAAPSVRCADVTPAQQKTGDSLVAIAQKMQASDVEMMVSMKESGWKGVDESNARAALDLYDQALAKAPGHCGAVFGRALAQSQILLQDKGMNTVVAQALPKISSKASAKTSAAAALPVANAYKASPDEAAPLVLRVAAGLSGVSKPYISAQQDRLATEVLPTLDSVIASLDAVMAKGDFAATYTRPDGSVIEIDAGEVGPVLGGMKVARAILLLVCGYQWEVAREGSYAWIDHLSNTSQSGFKNLSQTQRSSLDHLTGLFKPGSAFTRIKPEWKESVNGIPALLLQAVDNTIAGLNYSIWEASHPEMQVNDVYRVGTGENDDVDPKDLAGVVDALDRTRKYLKGEVSLSYNNGTHTLKLNFPKVFAIDGLQNYLPYHKVRAYEEWFTPMAPTDEYYSEAHWSPELGRGEAALKVFEALGISVNDAVGIHSLGMNGNHRVLLSETHSGWFWRAYTGDDVFLAELTKGSKPCEFTYVKFAGRERTRPDIFPGLNTFDNTAATGTGTIDLTGLCRETAFGTEYLSEAASMKFQPLYFTDASGNKTLDPEQVDQVIDELGIAALTGKIVFPDPTFGGMFPELNNDNIWATMSSLNHVGPRINETCDEYGQCTTELPNNPSDLDVWVYYLFWADNLL